MKGKLITFAAAAILLLTGGCSPEEGEGTASPAPENQSAVETAQLDRQGLIDLMTDYYKALVSKDSSGLPISGNLKFVENTAEISLGDGLWITASEEPSEFRIDAADPVAQQVASLAMIKEYDGDDALAAIRLKVVNEEITEAEHLVIRGDDIRKASLANLKKPRAGLIEDIPPSERMPREELIRIGLTYYDALTGEDGTLSPFADECERHENGMITAGKKPDAPPASDGGPAEGSPVQADSDPEFAAMMERMAAMPMDCAGQISTGTFAYITDIRERRVPVADVRKGLAVGFSMFWHRGDQKEMKIKGVEGVESIPAFTGTFNLPAVHFYKIKNGKIYEIEAIGFMLPYGIKSGW